MTSLTCQQVLTSFSTTSTSHNTTRGDPRQPRHAANSRTHKGDAEGHGKWKRAGVHRTPTIYFIFLYIYFTNFPSFCSQHIPPPPAKHHKRALYGVFIVFGRSYGLPHPPEHEKCDCMSRFSCSGISSSLPPHAEHQNAPPMVHFLFGVYLLDPHTENVTMCRVFCVCVLPPPPHLPNTSHCRHQPTTSPSLQWTTMTAKMEDRGWAYMVCLQIFIFFLYTNYNPTH